MNRKSSNRKDIRYNDMTSKFPTQKFLFSRKHPQDKIPAKFFNYLNKFNILPEFYNSGTIK